MPNLLKTIPANFIDKWQNIADLLAKIINVPAALIMKLENEQMEVVISSHSYNNPYRPGVKELWNGLYCETVIKSQMPLIVPNALNDRNWDNNPDLKLGMVAYLGMPIHYPDKSPFGTICVLDSKPNNFSAENKALLNQFKNVIELDLALIQSLQWQNESDEMDIFHKLMEQNEEYLAINEELQQTNKQLFEEKEKVSKSEKHFRLLVESSPYAIFIQTESKFSYVNPAALKLYGAQSEVQLNNTSVIDRIHPDFRDIVKQRITSLNVEKKPVSNITYQHLRLDNTTIDVEVSAVPFSFGENDGALVFVNDVTERKKLHQQVINNEQNLENIFTNSPVGIFVIDIDKQGKYFINSVNPAHENITGARNAHVKGQPLEVLSEMFGQDSFCYIKALYDNVVNLKETISFEEQVQLNNKQIQVNTTIKPLIDENGEVYRLIGTNIDISKLKETEQELTAAKDKAEKSEEKFRKAVLTNPDAITINRLEDGVYISANNGFYKTFEYTEDETIGTSSKDIRIWHNLEQRDVYKSLMEKNGTIENFEAKFVTKSGKVLDCLVSSSVISINGQIHTINITKDISYLKKIENDLIIAKEKAEESNRLKTEFLNNMSHEIRTPMNGIMGFSQMLDSADITNEKRKYYAQIVLNSSQQLLRIIDDILEISNLGTRQIRLIEETVCLNDFLMELFAIFNLKFKARNIPLYLKKGLQDSESHLITDKSKLHKILSNLLENALKFTNVGSVELGYEVIIDKLRLFVKDTGIGIAPNYLPMIFERFSREENESARQYGGLGLGLAISKENARLLGGDITVESEKGKGSIFYVTIPFKPAGNVNDTTTKPTSTSDKKCYNILIAEDEEVNYLYIEALLEQEMEVNYHLIHAKDGKEAVDICLSNNNIDLVLMDIKMPLMNGHEAAQKIKLHLPHLPIIAQTAYSTESDKILALQNGCDSFVSKPINKEKLAELLHHYLKYTKANKDSK